MGVVYLAAPVDVTPVSFAAWVDVDAAAAGVPAGASGVIVHISKTGAADAFGLRKNGSTDNRIANFNDGGVGSHFWAAIGVDGSGLFEAYLGTTGLWTVYITGYFSGGEESFFTNAVDKSLGTANIWTDVDISGDTGGDTAVGAIFEINGTSSAQTMGFRNNGSTDDRRQPFAVRKWAFVGVDGSEICEHQMSSVNVDIFLIGYWKTGATFTTNGTDRSTATTGSYEDVAALPVGAVGGVYEFNGVGGTYGPDHALRKNGASDDIYSNTRKAWGLVECDGSRITEQKLSDASMDLFEMGYLTAPPAAAAARTLAALGVGT